MKNIITALCLLIALPVFLFGQGQDHLCGTDYYYDKLVKENPAIRKAEKQADEWARKFKGLSKQPPEKQIIPVVFHVIHDNTAAVNIPKSRILASLERLNKDLNVLNNDTSIIRPVFKSRIGHYNMEFRLARLSPDGQCINGITRTYRPNITDNTVWMDSIPGLLDTIKYWNPEEYLNIWIVKDIYDNNPNSDVAGQANYPWSTDGADGIIMRADEMKADDRTLTHEVGHYLGLKHPFSHGCDTFKGDNDTFFNDEVDDTPPIEERDVVRECDFSLNTCIDSTNYGRDFPDMLENYMDYSRCGVMFTEGQRTRSQSFLTLDYRGELVSDSNLVKTGVLDTSEKPEIARFAANTSPIYPCENVRFDFDYKNKCQNGEIKQGSPQAIQWKFPGGEPERSNALLPKVNYNKGGTYSVTLKLSNAAGSDSLVKEDFINVLGKNTILKPGFLAGFEDKTPNEKGFLTPENKEGNQWQSTTEASSAGKASLFLNNYNVEGQQSVELRTPLMNLSNETNPTLRFDIAYAKYQQQSFDFFKVYVSTDCGNNWRSVKQFSAFNLTTIDSAIQEPFFPTHNVDWETKAVNLPQQDNVLVRFEWQSSVEKSNNVFMDNIRMNYPVGKQEDQSTVNQRLKVYPNPVGGNKVYISQKADQSKLNLTISKVTGEVVYKDQINVGGANDGTYFTREALNVIDNGIYFFTIFDDNKISTKKVIVLD